MINTAQSNDADDLRLENDATASSTADDEQETYITLLQSLKKKTRGHIISAILNVVAFLLITAYLLFFQ